MSERTPFTNLLLLTVLTTILLVSGSLQCAFDCLTRTDSLQAPLTLQAESDRCDNCHPAYEHAEPSLSCLNKACHQRLPHHRDLDGPVIYQLGNLAQPLYSSSRQPVPQFRAGSAIVIPQAASQPGAQLNATSSNHLPQTLFSIRSTVLLC